MIPLQIHQLNYLLTLNIIWGKGKGTMANISTPPNLKTLPVKAKEAVLVKIIDSQIKEQDFLNKIYQQQIEKLQKRKQQLEEGFKSWERHGDGFRKTWEHQSILNQSQMRNSRNFNMGKFAQFNNSMLDQSLYFGDSPTRMNKKASNQSPIRKLQASNGKMNKTFERRPSTASPEKYNKREQLQKQIKELLARITSRESKIIKNKDEISENLSRKIEQQEQQIQNQIQKWKDLQLKRRFKKQLTDRMQRIREEIFKQKQGVLTIKQQFVNRNKEIIRKGYTKKMLDVIAAYGGVRKA